MALAAFIPIIGKVFDSIFPDKEEAAKAKFKLMELQMSGGLKELEEAGKIIAAEANSDHWLVAAWRPITMLVFVVIIANNYILAPYIDLFFDTDVALEVYSQHGTEGAAKILQTFPAAYSALILDIKRDDVQLIRDRKGMKENE